ncbi:MAG: hypothetical protein WC656_12320 [Sulfurimonas sp.]|jgi:hypothetical protein
MYQTSFGNDNQITFNNENEYYQSLGYLAKSDNTTSLVLENNQNQGARTHEYRIHTYIANPPFPGTFRLTAGTGRAINRINCNEFINDLLSNHNFVLGDIQNINLIRNTIPINYINDFNYGLTI